MLFCLSGVSELATEIPDIEKVTRPPAQHGSAPYVQFVAVLKRVIAPVYDQKIRRVFFSCLRHLEVSNVKEQFRYYVVSQELACSFIFALFLSNIDEFE